MLAFDPPSPQLIELVESGADALDRRELAALLWSLIRRRDPALERVLCSIMEGA